MLEREAILYETPPGATEVDRGTVEDFLFPESDNLTPYTVVEYRFEGDKSQAVAWVAERAEASGWVPEGPQRGEPGAKPVSVVQNFVKGFGTWRSAMTVQAEEDDTLWVSLGADEDTGCPE